MIQERSPFARETELNEIQGEFVDTGDSHQPVNSNKVSREIDDASCDILRDAESSRSLFTKEFTSRPNVSALSSILPLNDFKDSDIESTDTIESYHEYAPAYQKETDDVEIPTRPVQENLSDFHFALGLWCEKEGIKGRAYLGLVEILRLINVADVKQLPNRLSTLQRWCRKQLPLPSIHGKKIPVRAEKQPSGTIKRAEGQVHYLDIRVLVSLILSSHKQADFHTGMAEIVDNPSEYWHSPSWGSSIRTCGDDFVRYSDQTPIFPSDVVQYFCDETGCGTNHGTHCGQIIFFGRDHRTRSPTSDKVLLKIRSLVSRGQTDLIPPSYVQAANEYVLLEDLIDEVLPAKIIVRRPDVAFRRDQTVFTKFLIKSIFNVSTQSIRSSNLADPIRGELELKAFGRENLTRILNQGVTSFPLLIFVDDFGLHRNVYHTITGVYAMPAGLSILNRQRSGNALTVALGPHGSEFNNVINCLHTSMGNLDHGCSLMINGQERFTWAPIMAFLGDMNQQQISAGFLSPRAVYCCRFCNAGSDNRGDLYRDVILQGRYHHQVLKLRKKSDTISGKGNRGKFLSEHGLKPECSVLQTMLPALDIVMSFPPDPAHSEYFGLIRNLYPLLLTKILTAKAVKEFAVVFNDFSFPQGWGRIQSPTVHMKSWSISECGRASIVVPIMLRCWLRGHHVRASF